MDTLLKLFNKKYKDILSLTNVNAFIKYTHIFEIRKEHPYALNSPYLGIYRLVFSKHDKDYIFDLFKINPIDFKADLLNNVKSYNTDFEVSSDIYNIFSIWLIHLAFINKKLSKNKINDFSISVLKMLHYKFLSSKLFNDYRYKAKEDVMRYTIESLSNKFDIIKYNTWKNVFYERSKNILDNKSIHYKYIKNFKPDDKIYYIITDIQTKLRSSINIINRLYYENIASDNVIKSYDASSIIDGKKVLKDPEIFYDKVFYFLNNQILNRKQFINDNYIHSLVKLYPNLSYAIFHKFLNYIVEIALEQNTNDELYKVVNKKEYEYYKGIYTLVDKIILNSFRYIISKEININNKLSIFNTVRTMYTSRNNDLVFLSIKESIRQHLLDSGLTTRVTTISNITTSFVLYIFLKVFEMM